jgi:hypothetical protein
MCQPGRALQLPGKSHCIWQLEEEC